MLLLISVTFGPLVHSEMLVRKPGCYRLQGVVQSVANRTIALKIFSNTLSEQDVKITLVGPSKDVLAGSSLELIALVHEKGDLSRIRVTAQSSAITFLNRQSLDFRRIGEWIGYPKEQQCP